MTQRKRKPTEQLPEQHEPVELDDVELDTELDESAADYTAEQTNVKEAQA